jgi:hypothetical protein
VSPAFLDEGLGFRVPGRDSNGFRKGFGKGLGPWKRIAGAA